MARVLKQIAPGVTRVAVIRDATPLRNRPVWRHPGLGAVVRVEITPVNVHDAGEVERDISAFARGSNDGLVVTAGSAASVIAI